MTSYHLPKKFFTLLLCGATLPVVVGFLHFFLLLQLPSQSFGAATVFMLLGGVVFLGTGLWALYHALWRVALRVEVAKDIISFYAALRTVPLSPRDVKSVQRVPQRGEALGALVRHDGGAEFIFVKMVGFEELLRELSPAFRTGFIRS